MTPEEKYRLMIYFVHSTLIMYSKTIVDCETTKQFRETNKDVVQRVFDEALSIFNYELSFEQMDRGIRVYINCKHKPESVYETKIYNNG